MASSLRTLSNCCVGIVLLIALLAGCGPQSGGGENNSSDQSSSLNALQASDVERPLHDSLAGVLRDASNELSSVELRQILLQLFRRYRECDAYADKARIRMSFDPPQEASTDETVRVVNETRLSVRFIRPNRFAMDVVNSNNRIEIPGRW